MDFDIFDIFNYLKSEDYDKIEKSIDYIIKNNLTIDDIDLNLKDDNNNYLLNYLIIQNNYKLLEKLFKIENIKIDIFDSDNKSILYIPIKFNYKKIFNLLLEYNKSTIGVSIYDIRDNNNNIALHYAIKYKNKTFIEDLLKYESNTLFADNTGNNSFHLSILSRDIEIIKLILKHSEKTIIINSRTDNGKTPLHYAVNLQEIKIVKLLLENGANIDLQDYEHEYNILHYAINFGSKELVEFCLTNNIDINRQDIFGNTALHYSVIEGNNEILNMVIEQKQVNCNLWNIEGKLPLHLFFKYSSNVKKEILDFLVKNTNLNIQDNDYESSLHLICEFNIWEKYENILNKKKLDILLKNKNNIRPIDHILKLKDDKKDKFIEILQQAAARMASAYRQFPAQSSCEICLSSWRTFTRRDHLGINRVPHSSSTWGALGSSTSFIYGCSFGLSSRSTSLNRALTMALGHGCSAKQLRMRSLSLCLQPRHISTLTITPILSTSVMYTFEILQPLTGRA